MQDKSIPSSIPSQLPPGWRFITMEDFNKIPNLSGRQTKQTILLNRLPINKPMLITHDKYRCKNKNNSYCGLYTVIVRIARERKLMWNIKHLVDETNTVAILYTES
jgi:hypothetical protein